MLLFDVTLIADNDVKMKKIRQSMNQLIKTMYSDIKILASTNIKLIKIMSQLFK